MEIDQNKKINGVFCMETEKKIDQKKENKKKLMRGKVFFFLTMGLR